MAKGEVSKFIDSLHPLILAIIIDVIKIIPVFDIFITLWLQVVLWNRLNHEAFKWMNISYDIAFDLSFGPYGDIVPLNTITVIILMIYNKFPKHNL